MKTSNHEYIRRQFYISREQAAFLRETAFKRNLSQARIVRDAIRAWAKHSEKVSLLPEPSTMQP
jgi:hypothetical protein